jgi:Lipoprotein confined to pathogenic Mycobacterium
MNRRRIPRSLLSTLIAITALAACAEPSTPTLNTEVSRVDIASLPTVRETQTQMLDLIEKVRIAVSSAVPETSPWRWTDAWDTSTCPGAPDNGGVVLYFPNLVSQRPLTDTEWATVFVTVKDVAAAAGLTEVAMPQNGPGNHEARLDSTDGRQLVFGTRVTTLITARVSCRRTAGESLRVDGRIPLPPDPQP